MSVAKSNSQPVLQPVATALKLLTKEIIRPAAADKVLFFLAPILAIVPVLAAWALIPFAPDAALANVNAGLLLLLAIMSTEVYGAVIAGCASNSKYAFLGALRALARAISYKVAMGFCFLVIVMVSGSMNMSHIVMAQARGRAFDGMFAGTLLAWNWLPLLPIFLVYFISCVQETKRRSFDAVDGGAWIGSGYTVEYSGMGFAMLSLAEYINMWLAAILAVLMFLGGWLPPVDIAPLTIIPGGGWLALKTFITFFLFIWVGAKSPHFRNDQIMQLGWKVFIPITLAWLLLVALWRVSPWDIWD